MATGLLLATLTENLMADNATNQEPQELTMEKLLVELHNKADADLSNCTKPYIIETYSGGSSWYRLYSDGWCEQGGFFGASYTSYTEKTFTFLKPFKDTDYFATCHSAHTGDLSYPSIKAKAPSGVTFVSTYNNGGWGNWFACGYTKKDN